MDHYMHLGNTLHPVFLVNRLLTRGEDFSEDLAAPSRRGLSNPYLMNLGLISADICCLFDVFSRRPLCLQ